MDDLQTYIAGYLYNSRKYFLETDVGELATQFMDEYDTDLDYDEIVSEIENAQNDPECWGDSSDTQR